MFLKGRRKTEGEFLGVYKQEFRDGAVQYGARRKVNYIEIMAHILTYQKGE